MIYCGPVAVCLPTIHSPGYTWCPDFGFFLFSTISGRDVDSRLRAGKQNKTNWNGSGALCCHVKQPG